MTTIHLYLCLQGNTCVNPKHLYSGKQFVNIHRQKSWRNWHLKPNSLLYIQVYMTLFFDTNVILAIIVQKVQDESMLRAVKQILSRFDLDL